MTADRQPIRIEGRLSQVSLGRAVSAAMDDLRSQIVRNDAFQQGLAATSKTSPYPVQFTIADSVYRYSYSRSVGGSSGGYIADGDRRLTGAKSHTVKETITIDREGAGTVTLMTEGVSRSTIDHDQGGRTVITVEPTSGFFSAQPKESKPEVNSLEAVTAVVEILPDFSIPEALRGLFQIDE